MPYAHREDICDADTHMMERPDWLAEFADADIRPRLAPFVGGRTDVLKEVDDAIARFSERQRDRVKMSEAQDRFMTMAHKGWNGLGAFDAQERRLANDLLGFRSYIVFPTPAFNQVIDAREEDVLIGGTRALNRGLAAFASVDPRMEATAYIPLSTGLEQSLALLEEAVKSGFRLITIDTIPPSGGPAFTHPCYDPFWARVQALDVSITLHVGVNGGAFDPVPSAFYANGKPIPEPVAGDAPRDALAYMAIHYNVELFLSAMIFDGVLERFPRLRIGVVELGATWIIGFMKHIDQSHRAFRRLQDLSELTLKPSEYIQRQIKVTPFAGEDIGWILARGGEDLLMFASDYPHHEGTDDPIRRFEQTMESTPEPVKQKFYTDNYRAFLPGI